MATAQVIPPLPSGFELVAPEQPPRPTIEPRATQAATTLGGPQERQRGLGAQAPQASAAAGAQADVMPPPPPGFEIEQQSAPEIPARQVGFMESAGRTLGASAIPVARMGGMGLAGALEIIKPAAALVDAISIAMGGRPEMTQRVSAAQESVFGATDQLSAGMRSMYAPQPGEEMSTPGQIAGGVLSLPIEAAGGMGIQRGVERAADVVQRGGTLKEAGIAGGVTGAANVAANLLPIKAGGAVGRGIERGLGAVLPGGARTGAIAGGAATGGALGVAGDEAVVAAENLSLPSGERFQELQSQSDPAVSFGLGAAFGALPGVMAPRQPAAAPRREPTMGTPASAGAAGTDKAAQRRVSAAGLPVPVPLTEGQATREATQQQFEKEIVKDAEIGKELRDFGTEQTAAVLRNFDVLEEQTGARQTGAEAVGEAVINPIVERVNNAKAQINAAYDAARAAGEMEESVSTAALVKYLNDERPSEITAPILKAAADRLVAIGGATKAEDGTLLPGSANLNDLQILRQSVGKDAGERGTPNSFRADEIKRRIDAATEGAGGDLYKAANKLYREYAQEFKNQSLIRDLISLKKGTSDRKIALEEVYRKTVQNGSIEDLRRLQDTLAAAGDGGAQAMRELRGAAIRDIRDQATRTTSRDETGQQVPSVAGLQRAVKALDKSGKLELLFGKQGAQTMRDLGEVASDIYTAPPGVVNTSGTAMAMTRLLGDFAASTAVTGIPAPILTTIKSIKNWRQGKKAKARIAEAIKQPEPGLLQRKPDLDARPFDEATRQRARPIIQPREKPIERPPETERVVALRKRASVLKSIRECLEA